MPPTRQDQKRRRRPALSCVECRRRKVKCDRTEPCGHCVAQRATCVFDPYYADPDPLPSAKRRLTKDFSAVSSPTIGPADLISLDGEPRTLPQFTEVVDLTSGKTSSEVHHVAVRNTNGKSWPYALGSSQEFASLMRCHDAMCGDDTILYAPETQEVIAEAANLLSSCKFYAKHLKMIVRHDGLPIEELCTSDPPHDLTIKAIASYFEHFEVAYRVLHRPTFLRAYDHYRSNGAHQMGVFRLTLLLVIAMGSSLLDREDVTDITPLKVHSWIQHAETWLTQAPKAKRTGLAALQLQCLVILTRQVYSIGTDIVWSSLGSLLHGAMLSGLHREPCESERISIKDCEIRRRLWVTVLEMNLQGAFDAGMPPTLNMQAYDTRPPTNLDDEEFEYENGVSSNSAFYVRWTSTSGLLALQMSFSIRLQIMQHVTDISKSEDYDTTLTLSRQLTESCQTLSQLLSKHKVSPFVYNVLQHLTRRFFIPLHCSWALTALIDPRYHFSRKVMLDASLVLTSPVPDNTFARSMSIGSGLLREGFRLAESVLSVELIMQAEEQRSDPTPLRRLQSEYLMKAHVDMHDAATERLAENETNVKMPMFCAMTIAKAQAIQNGSDSELAIARSARDSLEKSLAVLKARSGVGAFMHNPGTNGTAIGDFDAFELDWDFDFMTTDTGDYTYPS